MAFSAKGIGKEYDHRPVLVNVTLGLSPGDKIALVGSNGTGKSTLLRILAGYESPDEGVVTHSLRDEIGYLPQYVRVVEGETIQDVVTSSVAGLRSLENRMRELEQRMTEYVDDDVLSEYGDVSAHFEARGGYDIDARTDEVLANLGVGYLTCHRQVSGLSGGEKARVALAALLLAAPDVLLLDEPTNHVTFDVIESLQAALVDFHGPVLIVTHDRRLIRQFPRMVWTLHDSRLTMKDCTPAQP
jgi:macrolide transport system ATP-binding/permease protein